MKSILFFMLLILVVNVLVIGCAKNLEQLPVRPFPEIPTLPESPEPIKSEKVKLWSTYYYLPSVKSSTEGVYMRDKKGNKLVKVKLSDFCSISMEGSGYVDGVLYNYASVSNSYYVSGCKWKASGKVKFHKSRSVAVGNRDNVLVPFVSIACDQKKFKFGQKFFIPSVVGKKLPNGETHDGVFRCDDVGGKIKGNHIDTYIGSYSKNPFEHVKSRSDKTFIAYLIKE